METLGQLVKGEGNIYLTGGATAILHGWRTMTVDVDLKAYPEPVGLFEGIRQIKDQLDINVELASPDDFIPELPGWEVRSIYITRQGHLNFYHYDPYSQALSKIERAHQRDLDDVEAMIRLALVKKEKLMEYFTEIEPRLIRYPGIEPESFRRAVEAVCS